MSVSEVEIVELTNAVWQSMLGMETYPIDPTFPLPTGPIITASVLISGAFEGAVTLQLPSSVGGELAALMFGSEADEVSREEIADAVGELANMVGGSLKALVAQPAKLSLPSVTEGDSYTVSFPGTRVATQVAVGFEGHALYILLHCRVGPDSGRTNETQWSVV